MYLPGLEITIGQSPSARAIRESRMMDGVSEVYDGEGVVILDPYWINQVGFFLERNSTGAATRC